MDNAIITILTGAMAIIVSGSAVGIFIFLRKQDQFMTEVRVVIFGTEQVPGLAEQVKVLRQRSHDQSNKIQIHSLEIATLKEKM